MTSAVERGKLLTTWRCRHVAVSPRASGSACAEAGQHFAVELPGVASHTWCLISLQLHEVNLKSEWNHPLHQSCVKGGACSLLTRRLLAGTWVRCGVEEGASAKPLDSGVVNMGLDRRCDRQDVSMGGFHMLICLTVESLVVGTA